MGKAQSVVERRGGGEVRGVSRVLIGSAQLGGQQPGSERARARERAGLKTGVLSCS